MLSKQLRELLVDVRARAGTTFSGVGVLVSDDPAALPLVSLRPLSLFSAAPSTLEALVTISNATNEFHDGFHVLSPKLELVRVSQYFSPPIVPGLGADPARRLGGRYMAALFGSALPSILATGVASTDYGVAVFEFGQEVDFS